MGIQTMPSKSSMKSSKIVSLKEYGKGYLLIPKKNHQDYGTKYYHSGWWMPKHNAWFFKKEYKDYLENNLLNTHKKKEDKQTSFSVETYGKGYLLRPEEGHPDWGTKYYHNGWWMPKHNAWFFKKEYKENVLSLAGKPPVVSTLNNNDSEKCEMEFTEHGSGFLLKPYEGHPDWGTKYYHNGWWMPKHNAWFFKK